MELNLSVWTEKDGENFKKYIATFSKGVESCKREKRIFNCERTVLAIGSPAVSDLAMRIYKGNYTSFLDLKLFDNTALTAVYAKLLSKISDFNKFVYYLEPYLDCADGWYITDAVKFKGAKKHKSELYRLMEDYAAKSETFYRRMAVIFAFEFAGDVEYTDRLSRFIVGFKGETEYYVNMAVAWLVCELVIKQRNFGIDLICGDSLNAFTKLKAISKCADSYRVRERDKQTLKLLQKKLTRRRG